MLISPGGSASLVVGCNDVSGRWASGLRQQDHDANRNSVFTAVTFGSTRNVPAHHQYRDVIRWRRRWTDLETQHRVESMSLTNKWIDQSSSHLKRPLAPCGRAGATKLKPLHRKLLRLAQPEIT